jgi:hypothetical protein
MDGFESLLPVLLDNADEIDHRVASDDCRVEIWGENVTLDPFQPAGAWCSLVGEAGAAASRQSANFVSVS